MDIQYSDIIEGQELHMENVLSFRGKLSATALNEEMQKINKFISDNELKKTAPTVTITYSTEENNQGQIMDIEMLLAIDKPFIPPENCKLKPIFHLTNAVKIRHIGNPMNLQQTLNRLLEYVDNNGLTTITGAYNVTVKEVQDHADLNNMIVDIYVGILPNVI